MRFGSEASRFLDVTALSRTIDSVLAELFGPHRLVAQDIWFSAREQGFDSPWGY